MDFRLFWQIDECALTRAQRKWTGSIVHRNHAMSALTQSHIRVRLNGKGFFILTTYFMCVCPAFIFPAQGDNETIAFIQRARLAPFLAGCRSLHRTARIWSRMFGS